MRIFSQSFDRLVLETKSLRPFLTIAAGSLAAIFGVGLIFDGFRGQPMANILGLWLIGCAALAYRGLRERTIFDRHNGLIVPQKVSLLGQSLRKLPLDAHVTAQINSRLLPPKSDAGPSGTGLGTAGRPIEVYDLHFQGLDQGKAFDVRFTFPDQQSADHIARIIQGMIPTTS